MGDAILAIIILHIILPLALSYQLWSIWTEDLRNKIAYKKDQEQIFKRWVIKAENKGDTNVDDFSKNLAREQQEISELQNKLKKKSIWMFIFYIALSLLILIIINLID